MDLNTYSIQKIVNFNVNFLIKIHNYFYYLKNRWLNEETHQIKDSKKINNKIIWIRESISLIKNKSAEHKGNYIWKSGLKRLKIFTIRLISFT